MIVFGVSEIYCWSIDQQTKSAFCLRGQYISEHAQKWRAVSEAHMLPVYLTGSPPAIFDVLQIKIKKIRTHLQPKGCSFYRSDFLYPKGTQKMQSVFSCPCDEPSSVA